MLIRTLLMKNFRQFKGTNKITFSCEANRNVTVILGDNTFGKTTLLQAFNWCLYGKANFFNDRQLLNYDISLGMKPGEQETVEVEITLLHNGDEYIITRRQVYNCGGGLVSGESNPSIFVSRKQADGQTKPINSAQVHDIINGILPEVLSTYFFFDTERISTISERKDLGKAIKDFLGLSAVENAARHLGDRSKRSSVIGKIYAGMDLNGDERAKEALKKIQSAKEEREVIAVRLQECETETARYMKRKNDLEQILRDNLSTNKLQQQKDDLEGRIKKAKANRVNAVEKYFKAFNDRALTFFIRPLLNEAERILKEVKAYDKGVSDITKTSITELIKRGYCLCGREICEGNEAYNHLMAEIKYVPQESIGNTIRRYREQLKNFLYLSEGVYAGLKDMHQDIEQIRSRIHDWEYELDDCRKKISGKENMAQYESELAEIRRRLSDLETKKSRLYQNDGGYERDIEHYQKVYDSLTVSSAKNRETQKFLAYAEELKAWLEPECQKKEQKIRRSLEAEVNKIFDEMYQGKRRVAIDEQYHVDLVTTVEDKEIVSGESEGANRVKNFAFIAGLVTLAKSQILKDLGISSEPYPLVMDAPFSNTDEKHTAGISKVLPKIAEQIIMFVMRKDWNYAEPMIVQHIGRKYLLNKISETFTKIEGA